MKMTNFEPVRSGGDGPDRMAGPDREPQLPVAEPLRSGPTYEAPSGKSISPALLRTALHELAVRPRVWTAGDAEPGPDLTHIVGDSGYVYRRNGPLWQSDPGTGPGWAWGEIPSYLRVEASRPAGVDIALTRHRDGLRLAHPRRLAADEGGG